MSDVYSICILNELLCFTGFHWFQFDQRYAILCHCALPRTPQNLPGFQEDLLACPVNSWSLRGRRSGCWAPTSWHQKCVWHLTDSFAVLHFFCTLNLLCAWVAGHWFFSIHCFWFLPRSASTLAVRVGDKIGALKGLAMRLREISQYLSQVVAGKLPMNQAASGAGSTRTSMPGWWFAARKSSTNCKRSSIWCLIRSAFENYRWHNIGRFWKSNGRCPRGSILLV